MCQVPDDCMRFLGGSEFCGRITLGRFLATFVRSLVVLSVTSLLGELFLAVLLQPVVTSSPSNKNDGTARFSGRVYREYKKVFSLAVLFSLSNLNYHLQLRSTSLS